MLELNQLLTIENWCDEPETTQRDRILTIPQSSWSEYERVSEKNSGYLVSFIDNTITMQHSKSAKSLKGTMAHTRRAPEKSRAYRRSN